jgi:hypothetical protein
MALVEPPMGPLFDGYRKSCTYPETNPFYNFICVIEPLFKDLVTNDIGKSFLTAFGTSGAVRRLELTFLWSAQLTSVGHVDVSIP